MVTEKLFFGEIPVSDEIKDEAVLLSNIGVSENEMEYLIYLKLRGELNGLIS